MVDVAKIERSKENPGSRQNIISESTRIQHKKTTVDGQLEDYSRMRPESIP